MAETGTSLLAALGRRIRDPNHTALSTALVYQILTDCQRVVNATTGAVLATATLTRTAGVPLIAIQGAISDCSRIVAVRIGGVGGTDLARFDWHTLRHTQSTWLTNTAATPTVWDVIGRDLLVVYPAASGGGSQITVRYISATTAITTGATATQLPDSYMPALIDLAEQVALLSLRLFTSVPTAQARLKDLAARLVQS